MGFGKKSSPAPNPVTTKTEPVVTEKPIERQPTPVRQSGTSTSVSERVNTGVPQERDRSGNQRTARNARTQTIGSANLIDAESPGDIDPLIDRKKLQPLGARMLT